MFRRESEWMQARIAASALHRTHPRPFKRLRPPTDAHVKKYKSRRVPDICFTRDSWRSEEFRDARTCGVRMNRTRVSLLVSRCFDHHTKQGNLGFPIGSNKREKTNRASERSCFDLATIFLFSFHFSYGKLWFRQVRQILGNWPIRLIEETSTQTTLHLILGISSLQCTCCRASTPSTSFWAETLVRSPQTIFYFIIYKKHSQIKVSKKQTKKCKNKNWRAPSEKEFCCSRYIR